MLFDLFLNWNRGLAGLPGLYQQVCHARHTGDTGKMIKLRNVPCWVGWLRRCFENLKSSSFWLFKRKPWVWVLRWLAKNFVWLSKLLGFMPKTSLGDGV